MEHSVNSLLTKPKEWREWIIGTFDPTFKLQSYFFKGWQDSPEAISAVLIFQYDGYDNACRMSHDEANDEMLLVQACVGPEVFVYKLPYLAGESKATTVINYPGEIHSSKMSHHFTPTLSSCMGFISRKLEDPLMFGIALVFAMLIATVITTS